MNNNHEMEIRIKPIGGNVTMDYIDKIDVVVRKLAQLIHEKDPAGPFIQVSYIVESKKKYDENCVHDFVVRDMEEDMVVVQCLRCHEIYHAGYDGSYIEKVS